MADGDHPIGYLPGYGSDAMRMLTARTAADRAGLLLPLLTPGMRVLDLGCGPGTITAGLAAAVAPGGIAIGVDVSFAQSRDARAHGVAPVVASGAALPLRTGALDAVFAHAVLEHLTSVSPVLAQARRVLRPGGLLAVSASDWSAATIRPRTPAVDTALRAYWRARQRAGTDPFVGGRLVEHVRNAGFTVLTARTADRVDMTYTELARYLRDRLTGAGAAAAAEWAAGGDGEFVQRWVDVLAMVDPATRP